jgi:hypothetical protein
MNMNAQSPPLQTERLPQARLWFGTCAAAFAWAVQGFTCLQISTQACKDGNGDWGPLSGPEVRILLGVVTLILLAVAVTGGLTSYKNWRTLAEQRRITRDEGLSREDFMALIGVFLSVAFSLGIVWAGIPPILIDVCINAR